MEFTASYVQLTYTILVGFVIILAWAFSLKRQVSVLSKEVALNKEHQDKINERNDNKFNSIDLKLDKIIELIIEKLK